MECPLCPRFCKLHTGQRGTCFVRQYVARRLGCRSVAFTYNDPVIFAAFASEVAGACHEPGIQTVAVTAGHIAARRTCDWR